MPALDPGLPGALILILAVVVAVAIVWLLDRRRRDGRRTTGGALHGMAREESLSYFRDYSGDAKAPGVREEDRAEPWGEGESEPPG
jgi:hypothetical protein